MSDQNEVHRYVKVVGALKQALGVSGFPAIEEIMVRALGHIESTAAKVNELEERNLALNRAADSQSTTIRDLRHLVESLTKEREALKVSLAGAGSNVNAKVLERRMAEANSIIHAMLDEAERMQNRADAQIRIIGRHEKEINAQAHTIEVLRADLAAALNREQEVRNHLAGSAEKAKAHDAMFDALVSTRKELEVARAKVNELEERNHEFVKKLDAIRENSNVIARQRESALAKANDLQERNHELVKKLDEARENIGFIGRHRDALSSDLAAALAKTSDLQERSDRQARVIDELSGRNEAQTRTIDELRESGDAQTLTADPHPLNVLEGRLAFYKTHTSDLQAEVADLRGRLTSAQEEVGSIRREMLDLSTSHNLNVEVETNPRNVLPNGLTLLQTNPDCAAQLDPAARDHGWLYVKGADGQWVTHRKLADSEIEEANDQAADMVVKHGTRVRAG